MQISTAVQFFALIFGMALVYLDCLKFNLWDQVLVLRGLHLSEIDPSTHPHFFRYLLVYPIFSLSDSLKVEADRLFSYICVLIVYLMTRTADQTYAAAIKPKRPSVLSASIIIFVYSVMAAYMNGRGLFALLGYSYIVSNVLSWETSIKKSSAGLFLKNLVGHLLCTVSTGSFLVSIGFIFLWSIYKAQSRGSKAIIFFYTVFVCSFFPIILLYVMKNIDFYGGGFEGLKNMLDHGFGRFLGEIDVMVCIILMSATLVLIPVFIAAIKNSKRYQTLILALCASIFGGAFGYTTLATGVPILVVLGLSWCRYASCAKSAKQTEKC